MKTIKKHIIYGIGKLQKDFQYIFDNIDIDYYIEDEEEINKSIYDNTFLVDRVLDEKSDFLIYVCKRDREKASYKLKEIGLKYGEDFIFADELFPQLDFNLKEIKKEKKIAVWGRGNSYKSLIENEYILYDDIDVFFDSNMDNITEKLVDYREIKNINDYFVIVAVMEDFYDVEKKLLEMGIQKSSYVSFKDVMRKNSELMRKTYFDTTYGDDYKICNMPFEFSTIDASGDMLLCCGNYLTGEIVGNLFFEKYADVWKGIRAKIQRLAVLNGTYSFCNGMCAFLDKKEKNGECYKEYEKINITDIPNICSVGIDNSCNLYCSSCRNSIYVAKNAQRIKLEKLKKILLEQVVAYNPKCMGYAGNGEVFLSDVYQELLLSHKRVENNHLHLISNGNLFSIKKFKELTRNFESVSVVISVDAATEETYNKIRRGGNYKKIIENIKILGEMKKESVISSFGLAFVLQYNNVHEARDFVYLAKENNVDRVLFSKLCNWGTYSDDEFAQKSLYDENGIIKEEYKKYFEDEIFEDEIVDMGTVASAFTNKRFHRHNMLNNCKIKDIRDK